MQHQIQIIPIPAFQDNYIWLVHNGHKAIVVDPGDANPVLKTLSLLKLKLESILITHHHHDHIGGVNTLLAKLPDLKVFAPKLEQFDFKHIAVSEPDSINCADWLATARVLDLPGHTLGHIAFYIEHQQQKWLFCGDTLFGGGCGRLFEGTPSQMMASLQKLAALDTNTQVYCTHEYTLHNLNFALTLEPSNPALIQRRLDTLALRNAQLPSLPSTIALEIATNPFLRCNSKQIQAAVDLENKPALQVFTKIRHDRNFY
jgi:hydroxyacylglutathione hydrolase